MQTLQRPRDGRPGRLVRQRPFLHADRRQRACGLACGHRVAGHPIAGVRVKVAADAAPAQAAVDLDQARPGAAARGGEGRCPPRRPVATDDDVGLLDTGVSRAAS